MEEKSSSINQKGEASKRRSVKKSPVKKSRHSGKCCDSCVAALVADCVAICLCPCAVLSFLSLIFFKAPWIMGRRCLGCGKRERKNLKIDRNLASNNRVAEGVSETVLASLELDLEGARADNVSTNNEADSVYQLGYLGFGRSSIMGD